MKKCSYCGHENSDEATLCSGCGQNEFKGENPSANSPPTSIKTNTQKHLRLRILIAIGVGIIVSTISIYVAWAGAGNANTAWMDQWSTQMYLREIGRGVNLYQQKSNALPTSLDQLRAITNDDGAVFIRVLLDSKGGFVDGWQRPYLFSENGTNFLITSLGRDGKPGGRGVDADLTDKNPWPKEAWPTFSQFWSNEHFNGMIHTSIVCGILAGFLSLLTVRIPNLNKKGIIILVLGLCATLIGTLFVTTIITALHIPSGH